jgi:hypothetical protein
MRTKDYIVETFTSWFELIALMEYLALTHSDFQEVFTLHQKKYDFFKKDQNVKVKIQINDVGFFDSNNTYNDIIHKWLEAIVYAYRFLKYAMTRGGTYSHKVGPIWFFLKEQFKIYESLLEEQKNK